jgi:cytochrome c
MGLQSDAKRNSTVKAGFAIALTAMLLLACGGEPSGEQTGSDQPEATAPEAPATAPNPGKAAFLQCAACHTVDQGGPNRVGPNLAGIVGAKAGQVEGFNYSKALLAADLTWDEATLDAFIKQPNKLVTGTSMAFAGVPDAARRAAIIDYLKQPAPQ